VTKVREPLHTRLDSTAAEKDHSLNLYRNQRFSQRRCWTVIIIIVIGSTAPGGPWPS